MNPDRQGSFASDSNQAPPSPTSYQINRSERSSEQVTQVIQAPAPPRPYNPHSSKSQESVDQISVVSQAPVPPRPYNPYSNKSQESVDAVPQVPSRPNSPPIGPYEPRLSKQGIRSPPPQIPPPLAYSLHSVPPRPYNPYFDSEEEKRKSNQKVFSANTVNPRVQSKYQDVWALSLFLMCLGGFAYCSYWGILHYTGAAAVVIWSEDNYTYSLFNSYYGTGYLLCIFFGSLIIGTTFSILYWVMLNRYTIKVIHLSFFFQILFTIAAGVISILAFNPGAAVLSFISATLGIWFYYAARSKIPFTAMIIRSTQKILTRYRSVFYVGVIGLFVQTLFTALFLVSIIGYYRYHLTQDWLLNPLSLGFTLMLVFEVFFYLWVSQVITNTVSVIISGVVATCYLQSKTIDGIMTVSIKDPCLKSADRALTWSFGSICFGSLLLSILEFIRFLISSLKNQESNPFAYFCLYVADCILGCYENLLSYFTRNALIHVAIYGSDFCQAGRDTYEMFKSTGVSAMINDCFAGTALWLGGFFITLLSTLCGILISLLFSAYFPKDGTSFQQAIVLFLFVTVLVYQIFVRIIMAGVDCAFVCLAENPQCIRDNNPEMYQHILETYPNFGA